MITIPTNLERDWHQLITAIQDAHPITSVPCLTGDIAPIPTWTSDDPDDQHEAAAACTFCPVLTPCADYAHTYPSEAGVYGALTHRQRHTLREAAA
ncbi:WhiB family transcriptional regulator [Demequina sp. SO4-18]|uniref:WhiB family transcriptional regulator n=1 Tax=Demequina sp. SO4-18 TaxID=3401026 RepID=UPI003B5A57EE